MRMPPRSLPLARLFAALLGWLFVSSFVFAQSAWQSRDIGAVATSGRVFNNGTSVHLSASGADIWDNADEFLYYFQTWSGDGEFVARVTTLPNTHPWAKAAVMLRETLAADSRHAMICVTPGNGTAFQYRTTTGGASASSAPTGYSTLPTWLKLVRSGATITGFTSTDGATWTSAGSLSLSTAGATVYAGLAATSHNDGVICEVDFDNIAFTAPSSSPPGAPVVTPKSSQSISSGYLYTYQIAASGSPTSYSATGLPAGLTLNPSTGEIRGVCGSNGGSYTATLRATNSAGTGSATQIFVVSGSGPIEMPWIGAATPPAAATYRAGDTLTFQLPVRGYYSPVFVSGRPRFAFTLGGNPRFANYAWGGGTEYHTYTYTVTAADAGATGVTTSDTVDLNGGIMQDTWPLWCSLNMPTVTASGVRIEAGSAAPTAAPVLSTPDSAPARFGTDFSFQITASNAPTSFSLTQAPTPTRPLGVTLNSATGLLSGTLQASGNYTFTLRATNAIGTGEKTFTLQVPHIIASVAMPAARTYRAGDVLSFRLTFSNPVRVSGVPQVPLAIGSTQRFASYAFGTDRDHTFNYTVQAGDVDLDGSVSLAPALAMNGGSIVDAESGAAVSNVLPKNSVATGVIVDAPGSPPPSITSPLTASATAGTPFTYTITATNSPTSFGASGLPAGLAVNATSGVISGTPASAGSFTFEITASNSGGTARAFLSLSVSGGGTATWQARDIGSVSAAGSATESGGVVTIRASGADIWDNVDEFHFRYQTLTGDGEIVARVTALDDTHPWAKAGLMFRESLEPGSRHAFACVTRAFGTTLQYRGDTGGSSSTVTPTGATTLPTWLKLRRRGNQFDYSYSSDGANWTAHASVTLTYINAGGPLYVGLAVTSHNDGVLNTARFDNISFSTPAPPGAPAAPSLNLYVASAHEIDLSWSGAINDTGSEIERSLDGATFTRLATTARGVLNYMDADVNAATTYYYRVRLLSAEGNSPWSAVRSATTPAAPTTPPPSPWSFSDIGAVGIPGSNSSSGNTITIAGSGADIWETADGFRFVYRAIYGDVIVEAQVRSLTNTDPWAKAGVMIRQSLAPDARNVFALVTPTNAVAAQARLSTGTATSFTPGPWANAPYWVRLVRNGTRIVASASPDGVTWTQIAAYDVPMTDTVYAGFAVTSHDNSELNTAVFADPFVD